MGIGIVAREKRCRAYWSKHLELSKAFILHAISARLKSVLILGAGRLYDVPLSDLLRRNTQITLVDCDPSLPRLWSAKAKIWGAEERIVGCICELTGVIEAWQAEIQALQSVEDMERALPTLKIPSPRSLCERVGGNPDVVVSLNLLSQIPVYWRDRVYALIEQRWGKKLLEQLSPAFEAALQNSMGRLQHAHLELLAAFGAQKIVLLTDRYFYYYKQDQSDWQVEEALYRPCPEEPWNSVPGYVLQSHDSWLWHIAPQGIEQADYGIMHEVHAAEVVRTTSEG